MIKKNIWIISISVLLIIVCTVLFLATKKETQTDFNLTTIKASDHIKGVPFSEVASSSVVVFEYSDFQCPACRTYFPITKRLITEFGNRVTFVYRHFPLSILHKNAEAAARASEAASKQGKFWEMHDLLFEKQNEWAESNDPTNYFYSYAKLLGISVEQFKTDFNSKEIAEMVKDAKNNAIKAGLLGTPTFFVNGKKIENTGFLEDFRKEILTALGN